MEPIDAPLVQRIEACIEQLFVPPDEAFAQNLVDADAAHLPSINVTPNQGKLLHLLAKITGTRRILEIGTLGGYSTTWLARALPRDGKLVTLEINPDHAAVARKNLERSGVHGVVEVQVGDASELLQRMIERRLQPFDLIFIDADKPRYVDYLRLGLKLSRIGTVILADNVIRHGRVFEDHPEDPNARGAKAFNLAIASDPRLDSILIPVFREKVDGLSLSVVQSLNDPSAPM